MAMLFVAKKRGSILVSFFTTKLRLDLTRTNQIKVKFGGGEPKLFPVRQNEQDPAVIYIENEKKFLGKLKTAKGFEIKSSFTGEDQVAFEFDNKGFDKIRFTDY